MATNIESIACPSNIVVEAGDVKAEVVLKHCELYVAMHRVAASLAWMSVKCSAECTADHRIKAELDTVLDVAAKSLQEGTELATKLVDFLRELPEVISTEFVLGAGCCVDWLSAVQSSFGTLLQIIIKKMVGEVGKLSKVVTSRTPKFDHYLNDDAISKKLVKARLYNFTEHAALTEQSVALFKAVSDVSRLKGRYNVPKAVHDEEANEPLAKASATFASAKRALSVLAAVNIIFSPSAPGLAKAAEEFKAKKGDCLPRALVAELDAVAGLLKVKQPKMALTRPKAEGT